MAYGDLTEALAQQKISSLVPKSRSAKSPSMTLSALEDRKRQARGNTKPRGRPGTSETTVRYTLNGNVPELVAYRHYDGKVFFRAAGGALSLLGSLHLRKLRG